MCQISKEELITKTFKAAALSLSLAGCLAATPTAKAQTSSPAVPEQGWEYLGQCTYHPGLVWNMDACLLAVPQMCPYSTYSKKVTWPVDIYGNTDEPGWYRLNPYADDIFFEYTEGKIQTNPHMHWDDPLYINATNPNKVYIVSWCHDMTYSNQKTPVPPSWYYTMPVFLEQVVPENGFTAKWSDYYQYGSLDNGVISFPKGGFVGYLTSDIATRYVSDINSNTEASKRTLSISNYTGNYIKTNRGDYGWETLQIDLPSKLTVAVDETFTDEEEACRYYDMTGRELTQAPRGMYIKVSGSGKAYKMIGH